MAEAEYPQQSLSSQSAWILIAKLIAFALSVLLPLLVVRFLSQTEVGIYRQAFLVSNYSVEVLPLGVSMSAYYFLNRNPESRSLAVLNILIFNFVMGALAFGLLAGFPELLASLFQNPSMTELSPLIGCVIWLRIFGSFLEIVALANREARLASAMIIVTQVTYMMAMVGSLFIFGTVKALVMAAIIHGSLQTILLLWYLADRFPRFWSRFDIGFMRIQLVYALPFGVAALLYVSQTDLHNFFVGHAFSPAEFAIYSIGCFQLPLIWILYESVSAVVIPRMSELQAQGRKREMLTISAGASLKLGLLYFPLFFFLLITAEDFISTLFTKEYIASVPIFRINLLLLPFISLMVDPIGRAFAEIGRFLLKLRIVLFALLFISLWIVIDHLVLNEVIGLVVAFVIIEKAASVWKTLHLLEVTRKDLHFAKDIGVAFIAAGVAGFPLFVIYWIGHDWLISFYERIAQTFLSSIGAVPAQDFVVGMLFLGTMFVVYSVAYLLIVNKLELVSDSDRAKLLSKIRSILGLKKNMGVKH